MAYAMDMDIDTSGGVRESAHAKNDPSSGKKKKSRLASKKKENKKSRDDADATVFLEKDTFWAVLKSMEAKPDNTLIQHFGCGALRDMASSALPIY